MGIYPDVQQLLLQRRKAGTPYQRTGCRFRTVGNRRFECRLQRRIAFHGRRMESQKQKRKTGNLAELPDRLSGRNDGKLVCRTGNRTGQRRSSERCFRTWRLSGGTKDHAPVVPARIRLFTTPVGRTGHDRLDGLAERNTA